MHLKSLSLQNFRNYQKKRFDFFQKTTFITGENTSGKTNLIEAIYFLTSGKSFRAEKDFETVAFDESIARLAGLIDDLKLEITIASGQGNTDLPRVKKYLVNGVNKRQVDFVGNLPAVLFTPLDLNIIIDSPVLRRNFLNDVLEQIDRDYRLALSQYTKGLRQRNALLERIRETGLRNDKLFEYWDDMLIKNGGIITKKRLNFIEFANQVPKEIFDFALLYDKSLINRERLDYYKKAEEAAGITLVGPHRDDFSFSMFNPPAGGENSTHNVKQFGSRGQQRLAILQLKLIQLDFMEKRLGVRPVLLLDDIFSELDTEHINLVSELIDKQQTIITTTHKEFIPKNLTGKIAIIQLGRDDK